MGSAARVGAMATLGALAVGGPAHAALRPITGTIAEPGYTVIAVAGDGRTSSVAARSGTFRLRPRAQTVTLHLRYPAGVYAGPVVMRGGGGRAILGVRPGARLGRIVIRDGYARPRRRLGRRFLDARHSARARRGVPIGALRFGRVRARPSRRTRVPGDPDRDGIPNPLDIDDDGDLVLDLLDGSRRGRAAQAGPQEFAFEFNLPAEIHETANANAAGLTTEQIDALLVSRGSLILDLADGAELDCGLPQSRTDPALGGLSYCTVGGTGRLVTAGSNEDRGVFPDCCDADGDGFGSFPGARLLAPRATTAQIGTGDVLIERVTRGGVETQRAATLQYVPATVPALISYDDGEGNAATVSYPVPGPQFDPGGGPPAPGGPGSRDNPLPVSAGRGGDIVVTLRYWRPQRRPIPPEVGGWIDIGGLIYEVEGGNQGRDCPQRAYSTDDPDLAPAPLLPVPEGEEGTGGLRDRAPDRPADPRNTLTYRLDLTACLGAGDPWAPGETVVFNLRATDRTGYAAQTVAFQRR